MVVPLNVFPLPRKKNGGAVSSPGVVQRPQSELGPPLPRHPRVRKGAHVSSWALSCFLRDLSAFFHCRKDHSVALASLVTAHWSRSVHTSRPIRATLIFNDL